MLATVISAVAAFGAAAGPAAGATTLIGAVNEIRAGADPDPITAGAGVGTFVVQVDEALGTYAVPAGYGVITAWSHSTGGTPGQLTFKVYRPIPGQPGRWFVVGSDTRTVVTNSVHTFPVRIPVRAGDRIRMSTTAA